MGTATSRTRAVAAAVVPFAALVLAAALGGCGGSPHQASSVTAATTTTPAASSFAWLQPAVAPAGWRVVSIPSGASLPFPPGWRRVHSDPGTASATRLGSRERVLGYLNITPRQGAETLGNWPRFRVEHDAEEGSRDVRLLAAARGLRFLTGRGTCVRDSYTTSTGSRYIEIACLVKGTRASTVIVGSAPPSAWAERARQIERAISAFKG